MFNSVPVISSLLVCVLISTISAQTSDYPSTCTYSCFKQVKYQTRCGDFGWIQCTGYRSVASICQRPCSTTTNSMPINGGWSDYEETGNRTDCSVTCGMGTQIRTLTRNCTNPAPSGGGLDCQGNATMTETVYCNNHTCPVNGGWSEYVETGNRTACSVTCGTGVQNRTLTRSCTEPPPSSGGLDCEGESTVTEVVNCTEQPCAVNGGWSEFSEWQAYDECTVLCGSGYLSEWRSRTCTDPAPEFGGDDCVGDSVENRTISCNTQPCGETCPPLTVKYFAHPTNPNRYYQCDNEVAKVQSCGLNRVWSQYYLTCVHDDESHPTDNIISTTYSDDTVSTQMPTSTTDDDDDDDETDSTPSPASTTTVDVNGCQGGANIIPHPTDCTKFYLCHSGQRFEPAMSCSNGLAFNPIISTCDYIYNVPQCGTQK